MDISHCDFINKHVTIYTHSLTHSIHLMLKEKHQKIREKMELG